jgi:hypothetical protein
MAGVLKILAIVISVLWLLLAAGAALLFWLLSDHSFFGSPTTWILLASPVIPLGIFYALDRYGRIEPVMPG